VFGTGHAIGIQLNTSFASRTIALSHTDPYMTESGISRSDELFTRNSNLSRLRLATVDIGSKGFTERFGIPFSELDTIFVGLGVEETDINLSAASPLRYVDYVNQFGSTAASVVASAGWARDSRDNIIAPTRGRFQRAFIEAGTPLLDLQYYKLTYQLQQYLPVTHKLTLAANLQTGVGGAYGKTPVFPIFKNFYVGGIGSVRGYESGTLGPRDPNGNPLGGTKEINGAMEALLPLPGADRSLRALAFLDGGESWASNQPVHFSDLRFAYGFGVAWTSPIGPLKLSLAFPIRYQSTDVIQRFQFQVGTGF
jgi:outer membrane protein insertion porin family